MTCQMWIAIAMCVAGHLLLHFKETRLYRFAGAWIITGAFGLASGIAIPCWIECNVWRLEFSKAQAAEPAEKMADSYDDTPIWTFRTPDGIELDLNRPMLNEGKMTWPAKMN